MTTRPELEELNALAASISAEATGWRERRRRWSAAHRERRFLAESLAPGRRRRRHRMMAAAAVIAIGVGFGAWGVVSHYANQVPKAKAIKPVTATHGYDLPWVSAGRHAAQGLAAQGRAANPYSCQSWYDANHFSFVGGETGDPWHDGFIRACASTANGADGSD
jgi:hypothetical protein